MNHKRVAIVVRQHRRFLYLLVAVSLVLGVVGPAQVLPVQRVQAQGGVTLDGAVSSDTADGVSTIDVVHTTGTGVNRLMLVGVSANSYNAARTISSVTFTYDTTELTLVEVGSVENEAGRLAAIYGLVDPPSGQAGTVTVTFSGAVNYGIVAGVINFAEVDQTTPFGTFASATGQSTAPSVDLTGLDGSELVFDTAFIGAATIPAVTVGADQTERWNTSVDRTGGVASTEQATGGSVTMSWTTGTTSVYWSIAAVPINPAPVGPTYNLTMAVNPGGGGTTSPADGVTHAVPQDTDVDITATANVGYAFANWTGTGVADPTSPNTTVHVDGDKTVTANFTALDQYALTVGTTGDGSVTLNPAGGTYYEGTTVTLTPVAGPCYAFSGWSGTNAGDLTDNGDGTWSILMSENKSVMADFGALSQYTLTAGDDGHGSVTLDPAGGTYCTGTTVTLTPVPNSGYVFSSWSGSNAGDLSDNGDGTWSILMSENKSVTANFAVALWPTLDGTVSSNTADGVSSIDVPHTTGTGINRLMLVGVSINNYSTEPTIDSVTFSYDSTDLPLTLVGEVDYEGRHVAIYGLVGPPNGQAGTVEVTFSEAVGYGIVAGVANFAGVNQTTPWGTFFSAYGQSDTPSVDVTGLTGDELVFDTVFVGAATIPTLTPGAGQTELWNAADNRAGGVASTEQATSSSVTMSWTAGSSVYWSIGAVPINPAPVGPTHDLTMAVSPTGGGTTVPADGVTHTYPENEIVDIEATANLGYAFDSWTGDVTDPDSASTTVTMDGDKTVTANFTALPQYTLAVGTTGSGSVTLDPAGGTYYEGTTVTLTPVPGVCYEFSGWSGTNAGDLTDNGDGTWSITMDEDKSVTADFGALSQYTLTAGDDGHGSVTLDPAGGTYCTGTTVTLTPVPDSGYIFSSWSGSNAGDLTDNGDGTWSILMNENKSVTANFAVYVPPTVDGAASSNTADDVDSIDIAHTTGTGADRLMLVGVSWNCGSTDRTITSVTFTPSGGSASILQEVWTQLAGSTESDPRYSAIYSLLNPPSGVAGTVTVNFSGDVSNGIVAGVANFAGVDQANPLGTPNGDSTTSGDAPTVTLDGLSGDELVFDNVFQGASGETQTLTAGTDQTRLWHEFAGNARGAASTKEAASASSVTMSWTAASSAYWAIAAVPINPASAGVTCYALTLDHTGQGSDPVASPTSSTGCDAGQYVADQTINLSGADPDDGWGIASWYGTGDDTSTADTNSVTMPPSAHSAGVNYLRLLGDVDLSGDVDSTDALIVLTADAGLDTTDYCPLNYGDVNSDGVVNSTDALIMLTYDVGLPVGGLPVGQPVVEPVLSNQPPGCIIP